MKIQSIDTLRLMEMDAIEVYRQCPKIITVVRHADTSDDSEFHCIWSGIRIETDADGEVQRYPYEIKKIFLVPKQTVREYIDPTLGEYLAVRVRPQFEIKLYPASEFLLFVRRENSSGFLVPMEADISSYEFRRKQRSHGLQEALCSNVWFGQERQMV